MASNKRSNGVYFGLLKTIVSRTLYSQLTSSKTDVCLVRASVYLEVKGGEAVSDVQAIKASPGQASVAVERLVGKLDVIEATGVLR